VNGAALSRAATTSACPHVAVSRGILVRCTAQTADSASAPNRQRHRATHSGDTPASTPTLINAKLDPQTTDSARKLGSHLRTSARSSVPLVPAISTPPSAFTDLCGGAGPIIDCTAS